ncbi:hypothetical protein NM208_g6479 [Fusarium decemcellulare]|uniref:Uncharacterized protein n=1 Tax=Fusarium decemcellulare TaxID=57161 RepID=A0ACC1SCU2_9HYPO|nr:hypothetical protein NM208_g6479 [Fusarium decemcellulare]
MTDYTPVAQVSEHDASVTKEPEKSGPRADASSTQLSSSPPNELQSRNRYRGQRTKGFSAVLAPWIGLWLMEFMACVLLAISLVAIVVTLYPHQGEPLPQLPFSVSINTLLAIYTFVLKGAMALVLTSCVSQLQWAWLSQERPLSDAALYASAAAGPLGSTYLLWKQRLRHPITTLAGLITITSMAIDPFVQQLVSYSDCTVAVGNNATMPRTNFFKSQGRHISAGRMNIVPSIQTAINLGLYSNSNGISFDCSTGNCTFSKEYATIAYCSTCEDISNTITFNTSCYTDPSGTKNCTQYDNQLTRSNPNITSYLEDGTAMTWAGNSHNNSPFMVSTVNSTDQSVTFLQGKNVFTHFRADPTTALELEGCEDAVTNDTWYCRGYGAARCNFRPCVRAYKSTVEAGLLEERATGLYNGTWGFNASLYTSAVVDTACITADERGQLTKLGYEISATDRWIAFNESVNITNIKDLEPSNLQFPESMWARQCVYILDQNFLNSIWEYYLTSFFSGNITGTWSNYNTITEFTGPQVLQTIYNYSRMSLDGTQGLFDGMANSLTTFIRQNGESFASIPASGQVQHYATCLNVSWPWVALPSALIGLVWILLALTIYTAESLRSPVWKDYPLSLLFHSPWNGNSSSETQDTTAVHPRDQDVSTVEEMEATAARIRVKLENEDGVYILRSAVTSSARP